jgi:serine/threonine-protein kinase
MAPEQADGRTRDVDASTDQYALAVIAHELITGENPFAAETIEMALARVAIGNVPPTGLTDELDAVLRRALSKGRARRFPSVSAFAQAFCAAALAPVEAQASPLAGALAIRNPPAAGVRRPRGRRRDARIGFAAAAAIAITSFFGTGAAHRAQAPAAVARPPAPEAVAADIPLPVTPAIVADAPPPMIPAIEPSPSVDERAPVRRPHAARKMGNDVPTSLPPRPALAPDEDATLPPSDL